MSAHKHGEIVGSFLGDGWHAECQCDWRGPTCPTSSEAEANLAIHRAERLTDWPAQKASSADAEAAS